MLEFILTFLVEGIFNGIFGKVIKNPKVKKWTKTTTFLLLFESVPIFFAILLGVSAFDSNPEISAIVGFILSMVLVIGILALGIYGHIKNWNLEDGR